MNRIAPKTLTGLFVSAAVISFLWAPSGADHSIAVLPLEDRSGFDGAWNVGAGLADLLAQRLGAVEGYWVVKADSVNLSGAIEGRGTIDSCGPTAALFDTLRVGYLIDGTVEEFGISRFGIVTPTLGGYQSYRAGVRVSFSLWGRGTVGALLSDNAEAEVKQGGLGLTLFGKPTDEMQQWEMLDHLEFGSEPFMATIVGGAIDTLLSDMVEKIRAALPPQQALDSIVGPAAIVSVDGERVYINRGYEDGVRAGDRFEVFRRGEELRDPQTGELLGYSDRTVGAIRVTFLKSAHLSVAEVVERDAEIEPGDEVR
jgi:hypothetical protein